MQRTRATASRRLTRLLALGLLGLGLAIAVGACGQVNRSPTVAAHPPPGSIILRGAGSDQVFPVYAEVGNELARRGITLNYQLSPLAAALAKFRAGRVSFFSAASWHDPGNLPRIGDTTALYVPVGFSSVAVVYHVPGLHARLRLSGKTMAGIYLGQIRSWNSRMIARENTGVKLPPTAIAVVHGGSASDQTALITEYMAAASKKFRRKVGSGATVNWPGGTSEDDDAATLQAVSQTPGAIGYVEQPATLGAGVRTARLLTPAHTYVAPTPRATSLVGNGPRDPGTLSLDTVNAPVDGAYPVASEAYVLVYRDLCQAGLDPREAAAAQKFLIYLLGPGQLAVRQLLFASLPGELRASARAAVRRLTCEAQPI